MVNTGDKICFVMSPIGDEGTETRVRADQVLHYLIEPAVGHFNCSAIRADDMPTPGMITPQIIERVLESPLVVADLTDHNPNVFYELAIRHAVRKPFIQMIDKSQRLPFDVAGARTVFYDLTLEGAASAVQKIKDQIGALENNPSDLVTPISIAESLMSLGNGTTPDQSNVASLIPLLTDINSAIHDYGSELRRLRAAMGRTDHDLSRFREHERTRRRRVVPQEVDFQRMLLALREHAPHIIYQFGLQARGEIYGGSIESGQDILTDMARMLETDQDLGEDLRQNLLSEVETVRHQLAGPHIRRP